MSGKDIPELQNVLANIAHYATSSSDIIPNIQSNIESSIQSGIETGVKTLTPAVKSAITESLIQSEKVSEMIDETYSYYRWYVVLIMLVIIALLILSCLSISTTAYTNYAYLTSADEISPEELAQYVLSEQTEDEKHRYTYQSLYNYSTMREIESLLHKVHKSLSERIKSLAILDIRVESPDNIRSYNLKRAEVQSDLMINLVRDSWLSASGPGINELLLKGDRITVDLFVDYDDYADLTAYLSDNSYDRLSMEYEIGEISLTFKFRIYRKSKESLYLVNGDKRNPDVIGYNGVYPLADVKLIGPGHRTIRVPRLFRNNTDKRKKKDKPYLFYYWDNPNKKEKTPSHIELSHDSIVKHCSESFRLIRLNSNNIYSYLPELLPFRSKILTLKISHRVDIYRIFLLYKYGGMYLDSDIIVLKNPIGLMAHLVDNEFVGFGCTGDRCWKDGYMRPSNWIMASRKGSYLMRDIRENIIALLFDHDRVTHAKLEETDRSYHLIGKHLIWFVLDRFRDMNEDLQSDMVPAYSYYHVSSDLLGTRTSEGEWVTTKMLFESKKIDYPDESKLMFIVFYNSDFDEANARGSKTHSLTKGELLNSNTEIGRFARRALKSIPSK